LGEELVFLVLEGDLAALEVELGLLEVRPQGHRLGPTVLEAEGHRLGAERLGGDQLGVVPTDELVAEQAFELVEADAEVVLRAQERGAAGRDLRLGLLFIQRR